MKMSKLLTIGTLTISLTFAIAGCGNSNPTIQNTPPNHEQNDASNSDARMNRNFARADITGQITSVNGSQVTLNLAETPQFDPNNTPNQQRQGGRRIDSNMDPQNRPGSQNGQRQNRPAGDNQKQDGVQPPQLDNQRRGQNPGMNRQMNFTDETLTLAIPENIDISTRERGPNGGEQKKLTYKDLKAGDILQVWYSDKANKTISRIVVMGSFNKN